jgi:hypothetical protein
MQTREKSVIGLVSIFRIEVGRGLRALTSLRATIITCLFLSTFLPSNRSIQVALIKSHQQCLEPLL